MKISGKNGISALVIQDSKCNSNRITTLELEYPKFIHAEFLTHRMFSRNSQSSRAVPVHRMLEHIEQNPAVPVHWGAAESGMQASNEVDFVAEPTSLWHTAKRSAIWYTQRLLDLGLHKQVANRITEPFQMIKTVVTATEWDNFFELRNHADAQPEIYELAKLMATAMEQSTPMMLRPGDWHVPYVYREQDNIGQISYYTEGVLIDKQTAKMLSASCCAQVSYRRQNLSAEKARSLFNRLITSKPAHLSPVEHQATPMRIIKATDNIEPGVTHMRMDSTLWSNNFQGWIQHRSLIC
ncbi:THY1 Predicted alternative thymidylate synthase [uncultured Caudovirales phage]|uniref:THY1 Predicted alternative thymidylate synthase n=1 Tax=uncultured Caudovirales phage TaxID=2100421 RepID=A0A6J5PXM7_9CAUD|nr:THY1 Predicted alternative thymidylate synthase [uncultured Caudovirales phage]CAB4185141.1 THY1 Predicted alternative thymidylate synthase [uncultured Caudovirales phage]CAB4193674.1 THY1 Predicted alternative thymidylate synthase [uncultured Caudovirales phage]CAB4215831.1 THY1 Predicted alternative thymidylate synthase [uncultured Caudovirales phage]CAB5230629.1 THY1 Predicted alternative thymidylate synthase [uncultured Caudovirales phage]